MPQDKIFGKARRTLKGPSFTTTEEQPLFSQPYKAHLYTFHSKLEKRNGKWEQFFVVATFSSSIPVWGKR